MLIGCHRLLLTGLATVCIVLAGMAATGDGPSTRPRPSSSDPRVAPATRPAGSYTDRVDEGGKHLTNSLGMEFVLLPEGEFIMGSPPDEPSHSREEGPVHKVRISTAFWMGACEVTQDQYRQVMGSNPSTVRGRRLPVTDVDWDEAMRFCEALSQWSGRRYRLPTEAEWEYAVRAGSQGPWFFGDSPKQLPAYAFYSVSSTQPAGPAPVGSRKSNRWGLYDVYGNVWEWVLDSVAFDRSDTRGGMSAHEFDLPRYSPDVQVDPLSTGEKDGRIVRGGSFVYGGPQFCRSAARRGWYHFLPGPDVGFRVVCETATNHDSPQSQNSDN